jgi:hypothetical protein
MMIDMDDAESTAIPQDDFKKLTEVFQILKRWRDESIESVEVPRMDTLAEDQEKV